MRDESDHGELGRGNSRHGDLRHDISYHDESHHDESHRVHDNSHHDKSWCCYKGEGCRNTTIYCGAWCMVVAAVLGTNAITPTASHDERGRGGSCRDDPYHDGSHRDESHHDKSHRDHDISHHDESHHDESWCSYNGGYNGGGCRNTTIYCGAWCMVVAAVLHGCHHVDVIA